MNDYQPGKEKILIIDDQEINIKVLEGLLARHGFSQYRGLQDSLMAVDVFLEWKPDLVLLDLLMPNIDGYQILTRLRANIDPDDYLPIMVLTADGSTEARRRALSMGAADMLTKPFDSLEVMLRVTNLLKMRNLHINNQKQNEMLQELVKARTEDLGRQSRRLATLSDIEHAVAGNLDVDDLLAKALGRIKAELEVDAVSVLLANPNEQRLDYKLGLGFNSVTPESCRLKLDGGCPGDQVSHKDETLIQSLPDRSFEWMCTPKLAAEGFKTYIGIPLTVKHENRGVLELFHRDVMKPNQDWMQFVETLASQLAVAVENASLYKDIHQSNIDLVNAYDATIEGWSRAMDMRDKETEGHTLRVTELSLQIACIMGYKDEDLVHIKRGALLHDIGKLGIPDRILLKPGPLTDDEWTVMRKHPSFAYEMLAPVDYLRPALDIPYSHHEKWDGSGYPRGLKKKEIPMPARIFSVVDVWDALTSDRPYRKAWSQEQTADHIHTSTGSHFDPEVVEVFFDHMQSVIH